MLPQHYERRYQEMYSLINIMWQQPSIAFNQLIPRMLEETAGVYIIALIESNEVLYVGRTINIKRRMYTNHLMGNKSTARLKKYLIEDPNVKEVIDYQTAKIYIRKNCYFKFIKENDYRVRGMFEGCFSYIFDVRYIEREH